MKAAVVTLLLIAAIVWLWPDQSAAPHDPTPTRAQMWWSAW